MTEAPAPRSLRRHQAITLSLLFLAGIVNFLDRSSLSIANTDSLPDLGGVRTHGSEHRTRGR